MTINDLSFPVWILVDEAKTLRGLRLDKTLGIDMSPEQVPLLNLFATQADADDSIKDSRDFVSAPCGTKEELWAILEVCRKSGVKHVRFKPVGETPGETQRIADFLDGFNP